MRGKRLVRRRMSPYRRLLGRLTELHKTGGDGATRWRLGARLLASTEASAVVEYAVILLLVGGLAAAGVSLLGTSAKQAVQHLSQATVVDGRAIHGGDIGRASQAMSSNEAAIATQPARQAVRSTALCTTAAIASSVIVGYAACRLGTKRRLWRKRRDQETAAEEPEGLKTQAHVYVKRQNLLRSLLSRGGLLAKEEIAVRDLMTRQVVIVTPETGVEELKSLMTNHRVHHLLVCDPRERLVGVVSDRDLHARRGKTAQELMTPNPCSVHPDAPLSQGIAILLSRQISCLPVVEDGRLCGIITTVDLTLLTHCVLQSWLRLAGETQSRPSWTEELAKVAEMADHDLDDQQKRLAELTQTLGSLAACAGDKTCHYIPAQIESILAATRRLTGGIAKTYSVVREQCRQRPGIVDSRTDPLTGLSSRLGLEEILGMMIAIKNEHGQPFSLLLVAVGPSPELSDAQGAEIDSPKVQEIAEWVVEEVRGTDLVARYGPNAFAVALMHTGPEGAEMACERIRQALRRNLRNREYPNAIRLAAVSALDGEPLEDLLARADATLAEASPDAVGGAVPDDRDELDSTRDAVPTI